MLPRPSVENIANPKAELLIAATHSQNSTVQMHLERNNSASKGIVTAMVETAANGEPLKNSKESAISAVLSKMQQAHSGEANSMPLVTILTDFNLGYSGADVSPLHDLIDQLHALPPVESPTGDGSKTDKNYRYVKNTAELKNVDKAASIPVRVYTTGGGGSTVVPASPGLITIDRYDAVKRFSFDDKDIIGYYTQLRSATPVKTPSQKSRRLSGSPASPDSSPKSTSGILQTLARHSSVSSTELNSPSPPQRVVSDSAAMSYSPFLNQSPLFPSIEEKPTDLQAMDPIVLDDEVPVSFSVPLNGGTPLNDMMALLKIVKPRPSPIKTGIEEKDASDSEKNVTRKLF